MSQSLSDWNSLFEQKILALNETRQAGALLSVIPHREDWSEFLESVKTEWRFWQGDSRYPFCLLIIYGGNAFYEYESGQFWKPFTKAIETELNVNHQQKLNENFARVACENGLKLFQSDYVGSAVFHIGVALHSWHRFLEICKWALRNDEWKTLSNEEWQVEIEKRAINQQRLKNFLLDNREAATEFIQTMLNARKLLHEQPDILLENLPQRNLIRIEYFDEVPETAEFLFPENSRAYESLLESRPYLYWQEERDRIELHLPPVPRDKLANSSWEIDEIQQRASANSDSLEINGKAFQNQLKLIFQTDGKIEKKPLNGLLPFGLYDGKRFVNIQRNTLPIQSYTIISPEKLENLSLKGFDDEENRPNETYELKDRTNCFLTRLFPIGKKPEVSFNCENQNYSFKFRRSAKIEAYFFFGEGSQAGQFAQIGDVVKTEELPLICAALPHETNNLEFLQKKFAVSLDNENKFRVFGKWGKLPEDDLREYFLWEWNTKNAVAKNHAQVTLRSSDSKNPFASLGKYREEFKPLDLKGNHEIFLKSESLGFNFSQKIEIVESKINFEKLWGKLPSKLLPFFLLCQKTDGMTWNKILLAKDVIAPNETDFSEGLLWKYAKFGFFQKHGQLWQIGESKAVLHKSSQKICEVEFCGNPSLLWIFYQEMVKRKTELLNEKKIVRIGYPIIYPIPPIEIGISDRLGFAKMNWREDLRNDIWAVFDKLGIKVVNNLWRN